MDRKRAPGAGRKPQGEYAGKSATFTTRIQPELRADLDKSAKRNKRSLSQEVERRLRESFEVPGKIARDFGPKHIAALAWLVSHVGQGVELMTGAKWLEDRFTSEAFRSAINILLDGLAPETEIAVPERCVQSAIDIDRHSAGLGEQFRRPDGI